MISAIPQGLFQFDLTDHYAILGVSIDADTVAIRQRYLKVAYLLHPDTCKAETQAQKDKANELLSKLVNPAYERLCREQSRQEFRLILAQIGKELAKSFPNSALESESAQKLAQSQSNFDLAYNKSLLAIAIDQYKSLDSAVSKIAQLSELNLVYLMLLEKESPNSKIAKSASVMAAINSSPSQTTASCPPGPAPSNLPESPMTAYIRRAENCLRRNNTAQAILEMKDALKIDPNQITCHALLGLAYLRQNQTTMAKVHINRAWNANPNDPTIAQIKQELEAVLALQQPTPNNKSQKNQGGGFWTIFGGKKN